MLTIRLSRIGKKKKPFYRLTVSEKARDPYGRALEILGSYNPFSKELNVKKDRIEYYLGNGAGMSPSVNNLLIEKGIIKGDKVTASKINAKKKGEEKEETKPKEVPKKEEVKTEKAEEPKKEAEVKEDEKK